MQAQTGKLVVVVVQEFCNRGTLDNAIRRNVFMPTQLWGARIAYRAMLRTAAEVARGLLQLHDCGVVHGDLKVRSPAGRWVGGFKLWSTASGLHALHRAPQYRYHCTR